jgi:signal transduction histidine kinase
MVALSHDLRTPLTAIKLTAQLIARGRDASGPLVSSAQRISATIDRADGMIGNLLDANQLRAGERLHLEMKECDLVLIARQTIDELTIMHGERFKLRASGPVLGFWNREGIGRILENLCSNGIKYGDPAKQISVGICTDAELVKISVHNEGPFIPQAEQATLFDPFKRAESAKSGQQKGWGLGLTLVKGLCEAHGGSVNVESAPGRGTTFQIRLPHDAMAAR